MTELRRNGGLVETRVVQVAVGWYYRLAPYLPSHRGIDVAALLARLDAVETDLLQYAVDGHVQPPRPIEEEQ